MPAKHTSTSRPRVGDHVRSTTDTPGPGVYRVVGVSGESVTLLHVADSDGRRQHTGETSSVTVEALDSMERTTNPDENRPVSAAIAAQLDGFWWSLRLIEKRARQRPLLSVPAIVLIVVGLVGERYLPIPELITTLSFLVGALTLVFLPRLGPPRGR